MLPANIQRLMLQGKFSPQGPNTVSAILGTTERGKLSEAEVFHSMYTFYMETP